MTRTIFTVIPIHTTFGTKELEAMKSFTDKKQAQKYKAKFKNGSFFARIVKSELVED